MEILNTLKGKLVCVDTAPFIYFIENHRRYSKFLSKFFSYVDEGHLRIVTSSITLLEVLVHPYRNDRLDLIEKYETILTESSGVNLVPVDAEIAKEAAEIRGRYSLLTPDAIQLAVPPRERQRTGAGHLQLSAGWLRDDVPVRRRHRCSARRLRGDHQHQALTTRSGAINGPRCSDRRHRTGEGSRPCSTPSAAASGRRPRCPAPSPGWATAGCPAGSATPRPAAANRRGRLRR